MSGKAPTSRKRPSNTQWHTRYPTARPKPSQDGVIERIEKQRALGVSGFIIEFFGRDTREPARLFAEKVMPAFA